jgi:hypothetical protein
MMHSANRVFGRQQQERLPGSERPDSIELVGRPLWASQQRARTDLVRRHYTRRGTASLGRRCVLARTQQKEAGSRLAHRGGK